jgi:DNA repair photolyase
MRTNTLSTDDALQLVGRIAPKFRPVWEGRPQAEQAALTQYFLPHHSAKPVLEPTRPKIIKWYCPFACQSDFPTGHRYCINVYTGCQHQCVYCYAMSYSPQTASTKRAFEQMLLGDMADLERFDVPPTPVHLSNSTDPLQPLEAKAGHTRLALEQILEHRNRFTTVTILTKNPMLAIERGYTDLFRALSILPADHPRCAEFAARGLPAFCMEVSLAFWRDEARAWYDVAAPSTESRKQAVRALSDMGIPIVLRVDPLFPRSPLNAKQAMADFGLPEAQTLDDLQNLVTFACEVKARHIVYSPAKIVKPRGRKLCPKMQALKQAYECMATSRQLVWRGGSWRLPDDLAKEQTVKPFLDICAGAGMPAKFCKQNLIETA